MIKLRMLLPFKIIYEIVMWLPKRIFNWFSFEESRRVGIVVPDQRLELQEDVSHTLKETSYLHPETELNIWYTERNRGLPSTTRNIVEIITDLLPEGKLNQKDLVYQEQHYCNNWSYLFKYEDYKKNKSCFKFYIKDYSIGPHGELVKNNWRTKFKLKSNELILLNDHTKITEEIKNEDEDTKKKDGLPT